MEREEFFNELRSRAAEDLARFYFEREEIVAFDGRESYLSFKNFVMNELVEAEYVAVVGTGNWRFSLNPDKDFKAFDEKSDIDLAVISIKRFNDAWEEIRKVHRTRWYRVTSEAKQQLRRNGENVYAGFVTPSWIPDPTSVIRYDHKALLNRLSNRSPGRREVKLFYFKNDIEALDYYKRGFIVAQKRVRTA
jgi:hypothetical protein